MPATQALIQQAQQLLTSWQEAAVTAGLNTQLDAETQTRALRVFEASEFVALTAQRQPQVFRALVDEGLLSRPYAEGEMAARLAKPLAEIGDENALQAALRRYRQQEILRIIWRDISELASLDETLKDLSTLADNCVQQALDKLYFWLCDQFGTPLGQESGQPQRLLVLGMGKLGAYELNLSSDIDLIFAYEESGETDAPRPLANETFFIRLCQRLIQALDKPTAEGFVFRTDARLRPFGESGPLACSFDFMEDYYQSQAREWERYAMIKARVITGDATASKRLMALLKPFVYRRYLDYGAIESLRGMKQLIADEMHKKGMAANIKLGRGGIREIEFIGQAFQLIRGGRQPALQLRPILPVLNQLQILTLLPAQAVQELTEAYRFLRLTENRLQAWQDKQTHILPADPLQRLRLARSMGYGDWVAFEAQLETHRQRVQQHFDQVFYQGNRDTPEPESPWHGLWQQNLSQEQALTLLQKSGFLFSEQSWNLLTTFRDSSAVRSLSEKGRTRLDQLMPLLFKRCAQAEDADTLWQRLLALVEAIVRRTAYLALLVENPHALDQLVLLAGKSLRISHLLTRHPLLLDELLDPRELYAPLTPEPLCQELSALLDPVSGDLEQQMERLRQFAHSNQLRVAAADLTEVIPLPVVSDYLTHIAEVCCQSVLQLAWEDLVAKHGRPTGISSEDNGLIVVGYGKLGGIELGYGSDLDLVLLHTDHDQTAMTDGERPIPNETFYARLGLRFIHIFTTRTAGGQLYELDMRLRPNGNSGQMVASMSSFATYQREAAWTWEHQALTRARVVAGDAKLAADFAQIRRDILMQPRDLASLKTEVREMREKMRNSLDKSDPALFDIKQGRGSIADIEFMVQFSVLRWAHRYGDLTQWTDNLRLLETLARLQLLPSESAAQLSQAYQGLRAQYHRQSLQEAPGLIPQSQLETERRLVRTCWQRLLEDADPTLAE